MTLYVVHLGKQWKQFERVIAAIEVASNRGATVTWDEKIEGRQFDVAIRFPFGPHSYLALIECKNYAASVPVEKIDAFVTKTRDAKANKAVIVSKSGFQAGCLNVARRHGVELFTLKTREPAQLPKQPGIAVSELILRSSLGETLYAFPTSPSRLQYEASFTHVVAKDCNDSESLSVLIHREIRARHPKSPPGKTTSYGIVSFPAQQVVLVSGKTTALATSITFTYRLENRVPTDDAAKIKVLSETVFELYDELNDKTAAAIDALALPIGFDTKLEPTRFYTNALGKPYVCEWVKNGQAQLVLLESYVNLQVVQLIFVTKLSNQAQFVEIDDPTEIIRLQRIYAGVLRAVAKGVVN
jgi:hypothetical protein